MCIRLSTRIFQCISGRLLTVVNYVFFTLNEFYLSSTASKSCSRILEGTIKKYSRGHRLQRANVIATARHSRKTGDPACARKLCNPTRCLFVSGKHGDFYTSWISNYYKYIMCLNISELKVRVNELVLNGAPRKLNFLVIGCISIHENSIE